MDVRGGRVRARDTPSLRARALPQPVDALLTTVHVPRVDRTRSSHHTALGVDWHEHPSRHDAKLLLGLGCRLLEHRDSDFREKRRAKIAGQANRPFSIRERILSPPLVGSLEAGIA